MYRAPTKARTEPRAGGLRGRLYNTKKQPRKKKKAHVRVDWHAGFENRSKVGKAKFECAGGQGWCMDNNRRLSRGRGVTGE